ncbi:hypothetical protein FOZ63_001282, partial [Perkinsus olseni]
ALPFLRWAAPITRVFDEEPEPTEPVTTMLDNTVSSSPGVRLRLWKHLLNSELKVPPYVCEHTLSTSFPMLISIALQLILVVLSQSLKAQQSDGGQDLCDPDVKQVHGFYNGQKGRKLFFWFFESRSNPACDPIILWLNGGPGCSGMTGVFLEIGPCILNDNGTGTDLNPYSGTARSNLLFAEPRESLVQRCAIRVATRYKGLQEFFGKHGQYKGKDFYVGGESYGGHFVPAIAQKIHRENIKGVEPRIEIRGIAIGNGYMNPAIQVLSYPEMAYHSDTAPHVITYAEPSPISFLQVYRTGHFAAVGQPAAAQLIINDFISGVLGPVSSTAAPEDEDVNE